MRAREDSSFRPATCVRHDTTLQRPDRPILVRADAVASLSAFLSLPQRFSPELRRANVGAMPLRVFQMRQTSVKVFGKTLHCGRVELGMLVGDLSWQQILRSTVVSIVDGLELFNDKLSDIAGYFCNKVPQFVGNALRSARKKSALARNSPGPPSLITNSGCLSNGFEKALGPSVLEEPKHSTGSPASEHCACNTRCGCPAESLPDAYVRTAPKTRPLLLRSPSNTIFPVQSR